MSEAQSATPAVNPLLGLTRAEPPRSELARVIIGTLGPWGARFGLAWLSLMLFCAVFAPLLASSYPILLRENGGPLTSPLLHSLTPNDALILLGAFVAGALLFFRRASIARRLAIFVVIIAVAVWPAYRFCEQPQNIVYDKYRTEQADGKYETVVRTLIPFSPSDRMRDQFDRNNPNPQPPSKQHWMGTDPNGADVLSRMIHACRIALSVGFVSTGIAVLLGIIIGGLMGYYSGIADLIGMRLVEIFDAIPALYLILAIMAFWKRDATALYLIMVVLGLLSWPGYAVFIRAEFLKLRQQPFVEAAVAAGLPIRSVLFRHMLPNGVTPVLVSAAFGVAGAVNIENVLSFLQIGVAEEPSWGDLLHHATADGEFNWWLALYPGGALALTMFAFILIGESMRDVIDPYTASKK